MNLEQASDIVRQLADGLDPSTGEVLPAESPCQQPLVIRALYVVRQVLAERHSRARRTKPLPDFAGNPWSEDEDRRLGVAFDSGRTVDELSTRHRRTKAAIQARLVKLGKLDPTHSRYRV